MFLVLVASLSLSPCFGKTTPRKTSSEAPHPTALADLSDSTMSNVNIWRI